MSRASRIARDTRRAGMTSADFAHARAERDRRADEAAALFRQMAPELYPSEEIHDLLFSGPSFRGFLPPRAWLRSFLRCSPLIRLLALWSEVGR